MPAPLHTDVSSLLREVVGAFRLGTDLGPRIDAATRLVVTAATLPASVEAAIDQFLQTPDEGRLRAVQEAVVRTGFLEIGAGLYVKLLSDLTLEGVLSLREAAPLLARIPFPLRDTLGEKARRAVDVAQLVCEDAKDGVMSVEDDDVLRRALMALG